MRTSSSVKLEWSYNENDPTLRAFITGYVVTVQEVGSDSSQAANESREKRPGLKTLCF